MSAPETSDELRASLNAMYAADQQMWEGHRGSRSAFENQVRIAWPTIDALLARLTAAEADADRLASAVGWPPVGGVVEVLRLHDEALALRERPQ